MKKQSPLKKLFSGQASKTGETRQEPLIEELEPRILFSAAPAEPAPEPPAEEAQQETVAADNSGFESIDEFFINSTNSSTTESPNTDDETPVYLTSLNNLTADELVELAEAANQRWVHAGINDQQLSALRQIDYNIVDLDADILGTAEGYEIDIDINAAGKGWFIDTTPFEDEEFGITESITAFRAEEPRQFGVDLLSVLMHEQGHVLGLDDIYESSGQTSVMYGLFEEGERRIAADGEADGAEAASLTGARNAVFDGAADGAGGSGADGDINDPDNYEGDALPASSSATVYTEVVQLNADSVTNLNADTEELVIDLGAGGVTFAAEGTALEFIENGVAFIVGAGAAGDQTMTIGNDSDIRVRSTVTEPQIINANIILGTSGNTVVSADGPGDTLIINGDIEGGADGKPLLIFTGRGLVEINGRIGNTTAIQRLAVQNGTISMDALDLGLTNDGHFQVGHQANSGTIIFHGATDAVIDSRLLMGNNSTDAVNNGGSSLINNGEGVITFTNSNFVFERPGNVSAKLLTLGGSNTGRNSIAGGVDDNNTGGNGIVNLVKQDDGMWILEGDNGYTGTTTISGGRLDLNGTNSTSGVTIETGASLGGSGTISGAISSVGGTITAGDHTAPATLTAAGGLTLDSDSTFEVEFFSESSYSNISANGTVNLGGATLSLDFEYTPDPGTEFILISGDTPIVGTFAGFEDETVVTIDSIQYEVNYNGDDGTGTDVVLTYLGEAPAPEQHFTAVDTPLTFDFSSFYGTGFASDPSSGQLDSDQWVVTGMSDGDGTLGGTHENGDFARGIDEGGQGTGGVFSFDIDNDTESTNYALGVQPIGSDFTPGAFILKITNNTGTNITDVDVAYDVAIFNDQARANSLSLEYAVVEAADANTLPATFSETVAGSTVISGEAADGTPMWITTNKDLTLTGLSLAAGGSIFLRWTGDDVSGSNSRDEFAIDNIVVTPRSNVAPEIAGGDTATASFVENDTTTTVVYDVETTDDSDSEGAGLTYSFSTVSGGADNDKFTIDPTTGEIFFIASPDFENPTDADTDNDYEVEVTVTDGGSLTDVQNITVSVTDVNENVAPTVTADNPTVTVDDGTEATNTGSFSDTAGDLVTITASEGSITQNYGDGTWRWDFTPTNGSADSQTITITATDNEGAQSTTNFTLIVNDVVPETTTLEGIFTSLVQLDADDYPDTSKVFVDLGTGATFSADGMALQILNPGVEFTVGVGGIGNQTLTLASNSDIRVDGSTDRPQIIDANIVLGTAGNNVITTQTPDTELIINGNIEGGTDNKPILIFTGTGLTTIYGDIGTETPIQRFYVYSGTVYTSAENLARTGQATFKLGHQAATGTLGFNGTSEDTVTISSDLSVGNNSDAAANDGGSVILNDGAGAVVFSNENFILENGDNASAKTLTLGGSNTGPNTIAGGIDDNNPSGGGLINLVKQDAGLWIINGVNNYTGTTTISGGRLDINGTAATSSVLIEAGATLGGSGTINGPITSVGGTITGGDDATPGTLTATGGLTLDSDSVFEASFLDSTTYSSITANGPVVLGGATLSLNFDSYPDAGTEFVLIDGDSTVSGEFEGFEDETLVVIDTHQFIVNYNGDDETGNDVVLTYVGEVVGTEQHFSELNTTVTFDFEDFTAAGLAPEPTEGQLDSDQWVITGLSDGDSTLGGTSVSADFTRGENDGGVTTGGIYSFDVDNGPDVDRALGFQATGSDFNPGEIILKITNNTGTTVTSVDVAFDVAILNDQDRSSSLSLQYAINTDSIPDSGDFIDVADGSVTSGETGDSSEWVTTAKDVTISDLSLDDGESIFLLWKGQDVAGSGARDEFALNNIAVTPRANVAPVISAANASFAENGATTDIVVDVETIDDIDSEGSGLVYTFTNESGGGADNDLFEIDSSTGEVTFKTSPDFETPGDDDGNNEYEVQITVTDGGALTHVQDITITVTNENDNSPQITSSASASVAEGETSVTTVSATDLDGDTITYSITGGADQTAFDIDTNTGELTFNSAPDFDSPGDDDSDNTYEVIVTASDGTNSDVQTIQVEVTNINDNNPLFTSASEVDVAEGNTAVTTVTATDADNDTVTYSITGGADQSAFSIDEDTGVLTFDTAPDYEVPTDADTDNIYYVVVSATDGTLTETQTITVTVTDEDDNLAPIVAADSGSISVEEGGTATNTGTFSDSAGDFVTIISSIGSVTQNYIDGTWSWNYTPGDGPTDSQTVTITATDSEAETSTTTFSLSVTNGDPTAGSGLSISTDEDSPGSVNLLTGASDPAGANDTLSVDTTGYSPNGDGTFTKSTTEGGTITVDPVTGDTTYTPAENFNGSDSFTFAISDEDGGLSTTETVNITVTAVNDAPIPAGDANPDPNQIPEDAADGDTVGITARFSDADGDDIEYTLIDDADGAFAIDQVTGVVTVADSTKLDFESNPQTTITVQGSDGKGGVQTQQFTIEVGDISEFVPFSGIFDDNGLNGLIVAQQSSDNTSITLITLLDEAQSELEVILNHKTTGEQLILRPTNIDRLGGIQSVTIGGSTFQNLSQYSAMIHFGGSLLYFPDAEDLLDDLGDDEEYGDWLISFYQFQDLEPSSV